MPYRLCFGDNQLYPPSALGGWCWGAQLVGGLASPSCWLGLRQLYCPGQNWENLLQVPPRSYREPFSAAHGGYASPFLPTLAKLLFRTFCAQIQVLIVESPTPSSQSYSSYLSSAVCRGLCGVRGADLWQTVCAGLQVTLWKESVDGQWVCISDVNKGQGSVSTSVTEGQQNEQWQDQIPELPLPRPADQTAGTDRTRVLLCLSMMW